MEATISCRRLIENTYTAYGSIKVMKQFEDDLILESVDPMADEPMGFTVNVKNSDNQVVRTGTVTVETPLLFEDLPPGQYTVEEEVPEGFDTPLYTESNVVTVVAGEVAEVTITNRYSKTQTSKLTVLYKLDGTDTEIREPSVHEGEVGSEVTVYAPGISGYALKSGQPSSYEYTYGEEDGTYTFWYVVYSPPVTQYSTLTVKYMLSGTATELLPSQSFTREVGYTLTVTAPAIDGYELRDGEASSKTHYFTVLDGQITFWYVAVDEEIIDDEPPPLLPGTGGMAASTLYGIGISLASLGMVLKRKRR